MKFTLTVLLHEHFVDLRVFVVVFLFVLTEVYTAGRREIFCYYFVGAGYLDDLMRLVHRGSFNL